MGDPKINLLGLMLPFLLITPQTFAGSGVGTDIPITQTPVPNPGKQWLPASLGTPPAIYNDECHGEDDTHIGSLVFSKTNQLDPYRCIRQIVDSLIANASMTINPDPGGVNQYQFSFPYLEVIEGNLLINGAEGWDEVYFPRLHQVDGNITVYLETAVEFIHMPQLTEVAKVTVHMRSMNNDLQGMDNLVDVERIEFNNFVESEDENLDFQLQGFNKLTELDYLTIKGRGIYDLNESAANQNDLVLINLTQVHHNVVFEGEGLSHLYGVESLQTVNGNLSITDEDSLLDLTGLENLQSVGGTLNIYDAAGLTTLNGLGGATVTKVSIKGNPALTDISALNNLTITQELKFSNNNSLSCASVQNFENAHPNVNVVIESGGCQ